MNAPTTPANGQVLPTSPAALLALRRMVVSNVQDAKLADTRKNAASIRVACRDSFAEFVKQAWHVIEPGTTLRWNWHLQVMCDHLQAISEKRLTPWLIINVPPGSSKSTIVSVLWQAWEWGPRGQRHLRYVSTSFDFDNVKRDTRKTRDLIESPWYQELWPDTKLKRAGETSFANRDTGSREGVAFASITGKRGDRVVIDDPHSVDGAESETQRTNAVRKFMEGGLNRTNDAVNSAMVIVMQRLHEADLTGAVLAADLGFVHICLPMEFEVERRCVTPLGVVDPRTYEGQLMDPKRFPTEAVERQKKAGDYTWAGQYQQRPAPREGGLFKIPEDWRVSRVVAAVPCAGTTVAGWDLAGSKRKKSPYTVRLKMTRGNDGMIYVRHVDRRRTSPAELNTMIEDLVGEDGLDVLHSLPQDPGQAGKSQKWDIADRIAGSVFRITPETGDKEFRARPFAAQWEAGKVMLVAGDWNAAFIEELRNFPSGTYKDQVDAASRAYMELVGKPKKRVNAGPEVVDLTRPPPTEQDQRAGPTPTPRVNNQSVRTAQIDAWGAR
jgi:predicted phage terminase large subunit-like protein